MTDYLTVELENKAKQVYCFWSSVGFKVGAVTCFLCFFTNREIRGTCIRRDQISHIQSMVAEGGLTNVANVHTPM